MLCMKWTMQGACIFDSGRHLLSFWSRNWCVYAAAILASQRKLSHWLCIFPMCLHGWSLHFHLYLCTQSLSSPSKIMVDLMFGYLHYVYHKVILLSGLGASWLFILPPYLIFFGGNPYSLNSQFGDNTRTGEGIHVYNLRKEAYLCVKGVIIEFHFLEECPFGPAPLNDCCFSILIMAYQIPNFFWDFTHTVLNIKIRVPYMQCILGLAELTLWTEQNVAFRAIPKQYTVQTMYNLTIRYGMCLAHACFDLNCCLDKWNNDYSSDPTLKILGQQY